MSLLKRKHPHKDFFITDIASLAPKDDLATMEHPIFSLKTQPDMRELHYKNGDTMLKVIPSGHGLATIHDKDILIWAISKIIHAKNNNEPYSKTVYGSGYEILYSTNRGISSRDYKRLEEALIRLSGTRFVTNIKTGSTSETKIFGMVDHAGFVYSEKNKDMRRARVEVTISDFLMRSIESNEFITISEEYFRLRKPLERRLYELARKHCGAQKQWKIALDKLKAKIGSNAPLKKFRHNIKEIINNDHTPGYKLELTEFDAVIIAPRIDKSYLHQYRPIIEPWAEDAAREIAIQKGYGYQTLLAEWQSFSETKGRPKNPSAAFIAFCKQKKPL